MRRGSFWCKRLRSSCHMKCAQDLHRRHRQTTNATRKEIGGASIIDVDSLGKGGGQPKVDYSSKLLVINESIKGGRGFKKSKNESTSFMDAP